MAFIYGVLGLAACAALLAWFVRADAATIAKVLRYGPAIGLGAVGVLAILTGRGGLGGLLLTFAVALFGRARQTSGGVTRQSGKTSVVRTALMEMELDHDTGEMDGIMLEGPHKDVPFSMMDPQTLMELYQSLDTDAESAALFETYLDRIVPAWRDDAHTRADNGQGTAPSSGAMTQKEAYDILGLEPGAEPELIRKAHRRLMQRVHPDLGGSGFLAARINAAKDLLLSAHRKT
jgi:hypothetical protein